METMRLAIGQTPHDFFVAADFKQLYRVAFGPVAGDNNVSIRQPLSPARIFEGGISEIIV